MNIRQLKVNFTHIGIVQRIPAGKSLKKNFIFILILIFDQAGSYMLTSGPLWH